MLPKFLGEKSFLAILVFGLLGSTAVIADNAEEDSPATKNISTTGGFMIGSPSEPYWFQIGGSLRFDQRLFMGNEYSKGSEFLSGAHLRNFEIDFNGGVGKDFTYTIVTNYNAKDKRISLDDAFITYEMQKDFTVSFGQVLPGYSMEAASSSKWLPLFERSMGAFGLGTNLGLGVNVSKWDSCYTILAAAVQPKQDIEPHNGKTTHGVSTTLKRNDRWTPSARLVYRPIYNGTNIVQFGVSGYFSDDHDARLRFRTNGEVPTRNNVDVIDTGLIPASNHKGINLELAGQNGPLYGEVEYQRVFISRPNGAEKLHFDSYHATVSYVLTGEAKSFKAFNATFGQVKPACPKGAWEVAARYSYFNLTNKDITGGKGKNAALGLNYYANNNIKISGEYIRSIQQPSKMLAATALANTEKRNLNILGLRLQAVF